MLLDSMHVLYMYVLVLIHSGHFFKSTTTQKRSRHSTDTVPEFHTEAPQATASEGLAQGPYVAASVVSVSSLAYLVRTETWRCR